MVRSGSSWFSCRAEILTLYDRISPNATAPRVRLFAGLNGIISTRYVQEPTSMERGNAKVGKCAGWISDFTMSEEYMARHFSRPKGALCRCMGGFVACSYMLPLFQPFQLLHPPPTPDVLMITDHTSMTAMSLRSRLAFHSQKLSLAKSHSHARTSRNFQEAHRCT